MQLKSALLGAVLTAAAFLASNRVFSDDPPSGGPDPLMKLLQPGPEHEGLKTYEGSWEGKGTHRDLPWTSKMTGKMIMGGRFLQLDEDLTAPTPGGPMVLHMLAIVGYDNVQKKLVHVSLGDGTTALSMAEGQHDATKKLSEMRGVAHWPGGKNVLNRFTISDVADGAFHIESFDDEGAGEQKVLDGDY